MPLVSSQALVSRRALVLLQPGTETEVHWRRSKLNPDMPAEGIRPETVSHNANSAAGERSQLFDAQVRSRARWVNFTLRLATA